MFSKIEDALQRHEQAMSLCLVALAIILVGVAVLGKVEHKAAALLYVILP